MGRKEQCNLFMGSAVVHNSECSIFPSTTIMLIVEVGLYNDHEREFIGALLMWGSLRSATAMGEMEA
jgi:hypothetical protein